MRSFYAQFWPWQSSASLRKAIIVSVVLHVALVCALTIRLPRTLKLTQAGMYSVELINPNLPPADAPPLGTPTAAPPVQPQPTPPAPPPPPKKEEPKPKAPEPKKEEPKLAKEEKPKPDKPKEEKPKKEAAKEEPKKEPKKEPEKKPAEDKRVKIAKADNPLADVTDNPLDDLDSSSRPARPTKRQTTPVPGVATGKPGLQMAGGVPSVLGMWGGLVQRKVEKEWVIPQGIQLGPPDDGALISFWVNREGKLVGEPEVVKHAVDPAVAESAIRAIKSAVPYPALPDSFADARVQVYYTFIPTT
ncbi:MAG: TonB C-terminal domain-containing protein [Candidatus Hydrogenedentes bacterium]|nr:TonB C-terminal domain-containing protein [Candidatus Hydrogenedentota bacterium]